MNVKFVVGVSSIVVFSGAITWLKFTTSENSYIKWAQDFAASPSEVKKGIVPTSALRATMDPDAIKALGENPFQSTIFRNIAKMVTGWWQEGDQVGKSEYTHGPGGFMSTVWKPTCQVAIIGIGVAVKHVSLFALLAGAVCETTSQIPIYIDRTMQREMKAKGLVPASTSWERYEAFFDRVMHSSLEDWKFWGASMTAAVPGKVVIPWIAGELFISLSQVGYALNILGGSIQGMSGHVIAGIIHVDCKAAISSTVRFGVECSKEAVKTYILVTAIRPVKEGIDYVWLNFLTSNKSIANITNASNITDASNTAITSNVNKMAKPLTEPKTEEESGCKLQDPLITSCILDKSADNDLCLQPQKDIAKSADILKEEDYYPVTENQPEKVSSQAKHDDTTVNQQNPVLSDMQELVKKAELAGEDSKAYYPPQPDMPAHIAPEEQTPAASQKTYAQPMHSTDNEVVANHQDQEMSGVVKQQDEQVH